MAHRNTARRNIERRARRRCRSTRQTGTAMNLKDHIRTIPDFPKPGILFYDISTLLAHAEAWRLAPRHAAVSKSENAENDGASPDHSGG